MTTTTPAIIELKGIYRTFILDTGKRLKVLHDINLTVGSDEVLVLLGPSGCGKSTCLRIIAGLLEPTRGRVLMSGTPLSGTNPNVALVFQSFALLPWKNVADNVGVGVKSLHLAKEEEQRRVKRAIDLVGLEGFEEAYPKELSGGMKQRVGMARALAMERSVLCLDEAFSALDVLTAETLRREVLSLWLSKKTTTQSIILVTHNIAEAVSMGSRILVMGANPGRVRFSIKNDLPYPRDEKSYAFKRLVDDIHDLVTEAINPDTPEWVPPALQASAPETLPNVTLTEVVGFLEVVASEGGRMDAYALANRLMKDSVHVLILAKAAEILDFVDTPRNQVVLTDLGRTFISSDINGRKKIIHRQMMQLRLTQLLHEQVSSLPGRTMPRDEVIRQISDLLPNEDPDVVLTTLLQWGRYGELFGYNDDTKQIYIDVEGEMVASQPQV